MWISSVTAQPIARCMSKQTDRADPKREEQHGEENDGTSVRPAEIGRVWCETAICFTRVIGTSSQVESNEQERGECEAPGGTCREALHKVFSVKWPAS